MSTQTYASLLAEAVNRINDMLAADDGQAFKEARKFVERVAALEVEQPQAIGEVRKFGVVWFKQNPHAHPIGTKFYVQEPFSWEATTPVYTKYITDSLYQKLKPEFQKWYKPYACSNCNAQAAQAVTLTDEEIEDAYEEALRGPKGSGKYMGDAFRDFAQGILRRLKGKQ